LRASKLVDGSKLVVMGHSMGAGAVLDYATYDPNLKGAVMISGGFSLDGPERPRNTLFIFAQNDPEFIKQVSRTIAARLAGVDSVDLGKTYGDFANGTAVEAVQIPGADHVRIMWPEDAAGHIVRWLDNACGVKRAGELNLTDPRLSLVLVCLFLFMLLLVPIGRVCAGLTATWTRRPAGRTGWLGLVALVVALLVAMLLNVTAPQAAFLSLGDGHALMSWLAIAGGLLIVLVAIEYPEDLEQVRPRIGSTLLAAALAFAAIVVLNGAYEVTLHRTALTPERLAATIGATLLVLPFFLGFELTVRR